MSKHWSDKLVRMGACEDAVVFARGHKSCRQAWVACSRADWLFWYLERTLPDTQDSVESLTCLAIQIAQAIPNKKPIPVWDSWAYDYLANVDRTIERAAEAAEAAEAVGTGWVAEAAEAARTAGATGAVWAAQIVRNCYPLPPKVKHVPVR